MRNYKKKENPKQTKTKVTQDKLDTALHHLKNNCSKREAAKKAGINEGALRWILKKKENKEIDEIGQLVNCNAGMKTALPPEEETLLAKAIRLRAKWGFGWTRSDIQAFVKGFIDVNMEKDTDLGNYLKKYCKFKVNNWKLIVNYF